MTARLAGKAARLPRTVAVIGSRGDLDRAARLRRLPDLFELRLDQLCAAASDLMAAVERLRAPLIVTARHPSEGGAHNLSRAKRRDLLAEFLPLASYIDVELRSARELAPVLESAAQQEVRRIISVHDFSRTPSMKEFGRIALRAQQASADVLKIATRVDTESDMDRLIAGFDSLSRDIPVSAMGVGRFGRDSRRALIARGSVLNYAHLGAAAVEGQLSLAELRELTGSR